MGSMKNPAIAGFFVLYWRDEKFIPIAQHIGKAFARAYYQAVMSGKLRRGFLVIGIQITDFRRESGGLEEHRFLEDLK